MLFDPNIARLLDANANRAREALRVLEDYARFVANDQSLAAELKSIRHALAESLAAVGGHDNIFSRDTTADVGIDNKTPAELRRTSLADVITAAGKRLSEALRVLEECAKTIDLAPAAALEKLRYRGYIIEQTLARIAGGTEVGGGKSRFAQVRLYILLTESLCKNPWEKTLDAILAAAKFPGCHAPDGAGAPSGACALCIQLREKSLPDAELLARAKIISQKCHQHGALFILNDRPDLALLANADGIHVGQSDLPCAEIRKLTGSRLIIGVSTENLDQARAAQRDGATYIGVGPMFHTTTKEKPRIAGPEYAAAALAQIPLPLVPIGGITLDNLSQLTSRNLRTAAICSAIISHPDPASQTRAFLQALS